MNAYGKMKVWLLTLAIVLLAQQLVAQVQRLRMVDCGPNTWRLYNGVIKPTERGLNYIGNIAYGENPSVVHKMNMSMAICPNYFPCMMGSSNPTGADLMKMLCDNATNPQIFESCDIMKGDKSIYGAGNLRPHCNEMLSCMKDNTYAILEDVSCYSPNLDPLTNYTCVAAESILQWDLLPSWIDEYFNTNTTEFCWTYDSQELNLQGFGFH